MNKRLFFAINLPENIKSELTKIVVKLGKGNKNKPVKWVGKDNFHLTLHFLGDTPEEKITDLNQTLSPIIAEYNILNFKLIPLIDAFPNLIDPKVIFLEMKELNNGNTIKLQRK